MSIELLIIPLISFITTYLVTPKIINLFKLEGLVGYDINKKNKKRVVDTSGPSVLFGFLAGCLTFVFMKVFFYEDTSGLIMLFAATTSIFMIMLNGLLEDLTSLIKKSKKRTGDKKFKRMGFSQWIFPLIPLPAAIPLMAVRAGSTTMALPLIGAIDFGVIYVLIIIPIAITGAANATNMLGGINGVEVLMGAIATLSMGVYAFINNSLIGSVISLSYSFAMFALLVYNWFPAKVFPGDSVNFTTGAVIAVTAIISNIERFALILFIPWAIEFFLKARNKFKAECFGKPQKDGTLKSNYKKIYSWTHIAMKFKLSEQGIALFMGVVESLFCLLAFALSRTIV
jgi:UDP-N-acetylglucosamine--dolichyl-phosphate N-acetylglucosaminephosphotransferase